MIIISAMIPWILSGCISNGEYSPPKCPPTITVVDSKPIVHPDLPRPVVIRYNPPYIITKETIKELDDNVVLQAFEYDDGQSLGVDLNNLKSYIRQLNTVICSYRKELKEEVCKPYLPIDNETVDDKDSQ